MKHLAFSLILILGLAGTASAKTKNVIQEDDADESIEVTVTKSPSARKKSFNSAGLYWGLNLGLTRVHYDNYLLFYYSDYDHPYYRPARTDNHVNGGFSLGYRFLRYLRTDLTIDVTSPNKASFFYSYYLNAYGTYPIKEKFAPYAGIGLGYLHVYADDPKDWQFQHGRSAKSKLHPSFTLGVDWLTSSGIIMALELRYQDTKISGRSLSATRFLLEVKNLF